MASNCGGLNSACINRPQQRPVQFAQRLLAGAIGLVLVPALAPATWALPQGGEVAAGSAALSVQANELTVTQASERAVINYDSFSVAADERVQFIQPSHTSVTLNRVLGNDLSEIAGRIDANGQVFLLNPNGVLVGEGARVEVGGLLVSTLDISDQDFQHGTLQFAGDGGTIVNHGSLNAADGVYLVAPELVNTGHINAPEVALISGKAVLVQPRGSQIAVLVEDPTLAGTIEQRGTVAAERALLALQGGAAGAEIRNDGLIRASTVDTREGSIALLAAGGNVQNAGSLEAPAGEVHVESERYAQTGHIDVANASGDGGEVVLHATQSIVLHSGATITADAGSLGDGGRVEIIAQHTTHYRSGAEISARGGSVAGDGGFVEVSGLQSVQVNGQVDVGTNHGEPGLWYIDPSDIRINNGGVNEAGFVVGDPYLWDLGGAQDAQIDIDTLRNTLFNDGSVLISTASANTRAGDIIFEVDLDINSFPAGRTMTLLANNDILFAPGADIFDSSGSADSLNLVLQAQRNIDFGDNNFIFVGSGTLTATAGGNITVGDLRSFNTTDAGVQLLAGGAIRGRVLSPASINVNNGGVYLSAGSGIAETTDIAFNVARLGVNHTGSSLFDVNVSGDLTLTGITLGAGSQLAVTAGGNIVHSGSLGSQLDGATGADISLTSTSGSVTFNGTLADTIGAVDNSTNLSVNANSGLFMANDARVNVGDGLVRFNTVSGGASVTGLTSLSGAADAIVLDIASGNVSNPGDISPIDIAAPNGGIVFDLQDGAFGLTINANTLAVTSLGGSVNLLEADSVTVTNLTVASQAQLQAAGDLLFTNTATLGALGFELSAGGELVLPDAGIAAAEYLYLSGGDMRTVNGGRAISLSAPQLRLVSAANGGDLVFSTTADELAIANLGVNRIAVNDVDDLTLTDTDFPSGRVLVTTANGHSLTLAGDIDLDGDNGLLELQAGADLLVNGTLADATGALNNASSVILGAAADLVFGPNALIDVGVGSLTATAGGSIDLSVASGASLSFSAGGNIVDGNGAALNLTGDTVALTASGTLGATDAPLQLNAANASFASAGGGTYVANQNALSIASVDVAGELWLSVLNGDLTWLQANPSVGGGSTLLVGDGSWWVNDAGVVFNGDLSVTAQNIRAASGTAFVRAPNADLTFVPGGGAVTLAVDFDQLRLNAPTAADVSISDSDGLSISALATSGNAALAAGGGQNLVLADLAPSVGANLSFTALGADVVLPDSGLAVAGDLTVAAARLRDVNNEVTLAANGLDLRLSGAGDTLFNTTIAALALDSSAAGTLRFVESDGVTLTAMASAANVAVVTSAGDITVTSPLAVVGLTSLTTPGAVVAGASGLSAAGDIELTAADLTGSGASLSLAANNADITLTAPSTTLWSTALASLALDFNSNAALSITDADALTVTRLASGGDLSLSATAADLTMPASVAVGGALSLSATDLGVVRVPDAGFSHTGRLTLTAADLRDSDTQVTLAASDAEIWLRAASGDALWQTLFTTLDLTYAGGGAVTVDNAQALTVTGLQADGQAEVRAAGDLRFFSSIPAVAGALRLATSGAGNLVLQDTGLAVSGDLAIAAANIVDTDNTTSLSANHADLTLRDGSAATLLNTRLASVALNQTGGGALTLVNDQALVVTALASGGDVTLQSPGDLTFTTGSALVNGNLFAVAGGDVIVPDAGFSSANRLQINAVELRDSDLNLTLAAAAAEIVLSGGNQAAAWTTSLNELAVSRTGTGTLQLANSGGLTLAQWQTGGHASISAAGDMQLLANPQVLGDLSLTASGALQVPAGGLLHMGNLTVLAASLTDGDGALSLAANTLDLRLANQTSALDLNTAIDRLSAALTGAGDLNLANSRALEVVALQTSGDAALQAAGDLTLGVNPAVGGDLALVTSGALRLPASGLNLDRDLLIDAASLSASGANPRLAATNATVRLREQATASVWESAFTSLIAEVAGGGALTIANSLPLTVTSLVSGGDASVSAAGNLTLQDAAPSVAGRLQLTTATGGVLRVSDAGLRVAGELIIDADDMQDSDRELSLAAASASLRLRALAAPLNLQTEFASAVWDVLGASVVVNQTGASTLAGLTASHAFALTSNAGLTVTAERLNTTAAVDFSTGPADLVLPANGLTSAGSLALAAAGLRAADNGPIRLVAASAALNLSDATALALEVELNQLALTANTATTLDLVATGDLTLSQWQTDALADLNLVAEGTVQLPAAGLSATNRLAIAARDLLDDDRSLNLTARELLLSATAPAGNLTINTAAERLDLVLGGRASASINQSGGVRLVDLNGDLQALAVNDGNLQLRVTDGDLVVDANIAAADLTADGERAGVIDLGVTRGGLLLGDTNNVTLTAHNDVDQAPSHGSAPGSTAPGIVLQLLDAEAVDRSLRVGSATTNATLIATGADILLHARDSATPASAARTVTISEGSTLAAHNQATDPATGEVVINGTPVAGIPVAGIPVAGTPVAALRAAAGRRIELVMDYELPVEPPLPDTNFLDEVDPVAQILDPAEVTASPGQQVSVQFVKVFGECHEADAEVEKRCRIEAALQLFLSHWLVGGELPPKTEI